MTRALIGVLIAVAGCLPQRLAAGASDVAPPDFAWWREARFGMFVHWGPVALTGREISWSRARSNPNSPNQGPTPVEVYDNLYKEFNPVKFDADAWFGVAKRAGARYLVLTVKHCDGFLLWDSKTIDYTIMRTPFGRDVCAELAAASRRAGIPFCIYFSPPDWKDPDCRDPQHNDRFVKRMHEQLTELLTRYGRIPLIWFDFDGYPNPSLPEETATLVRRLQPGVLITCRLEALTSDESHGLVGKWGDYATPEQFVGSYCDTLPWETCMTIGRQWSYKPDEPIKSLKECLRILVSTVGGDGNLLLNVGPRPDGAIEPGQVERLEEIGEWLKRHGEAVYGTRGGPYHATKDYASTRTSNAVYVCAMEVAGDSVELPPLPVRVKSARWFDGTAVEFAQTADALRLTLPADRRDPVVSVVKLEVDGDPLRIPAIVPRSTSHSLAYRRPAKASSSLAPQFMHTPEAALDDQPATFWSTGRDEPVASQYAGRRFEHIQFQPAHRIWLRSGWLEVDLGQSATVTRGVLQEHVSNRFSPVTSWKIEYDQAGKWTTAVQGTAIGKRHEVSFPAPVGARRWRLSVEAPGHPAISEFQLF